VSTEKGLTAFAHVHFSTIIFCLCFVSCIRATFVRITFYTHTHTTYTNYPLFFFSSLSTSLSLSLSVGLSVPVYTCLCLFRSSLYFSTSLASLSRLSSRSHFGAVVCFKPLHFDCRLLSIWHLFSILSFLSFFLIEFKHLNLKTLNVV
jgi:hypothetical protein